MIAETLITLFSSHEALEAVSLFLDPASALELTRTCTALYCNLPRNSAMAIQTWSMYLTDPRYLTNQLVLETARGLVASKDVSRSNYKFILAVLIQKNGFMKVNRLKSLCASGKLSSPVLPHKGGWRCLVRLDQFALKRATKESASGQLSQPEEISASVDVKFVARIAGQKGKTYLLKQKLKSLCDTDTADGYLDDMHVIFKILLKESNWMGLIDVLASAYDIIPLETVNKALNSSLVPFRTNLKDSLLHLIVKDSSLRVQDKLRLVDLLLAFPSMKALVNEVNLNHEAPLVLVTKTAPKSSPDIDVWQQLATKLISAGADKYLCDRKGLFYEPLVSGA
jgi:hypothetical protein